MMVNLRTARTSLNVRPEKCGVILWFGLQPWMSRERWTIAWKGEP